MVKRLVAPGHIAAASGSAAGHPLVTRSGLTPQRQTNAAGVTAAGATNKTTQAPPATGSMSAVREASCPCLSGFRPGLKDDAAPTTRGRVGFLRVTLRVRQRRLRRWGERPRPRRLFRWQRRGCGSARC